MFVADDLYYSAYDSTRFLINPFVRPRRINRLQFIGQVVMVSQKQILKQRYCQILIDILVA